MVQPPLVYKNFNMMTIPAVIPKNHSVQSGVSLIEVLVSLLILATVVMGVFGVFAQTIIESQRAERIAIAMQRISNDEAVLQSLDDQARQAYHQMLTQLAATAGGQSPMAQYHRASHALTIDCTACTPVRYAQSLAVQTAQVASAGHLVIDRVSCQTKQCWQIRWGNADPSACQYLQSTQRHASAGCLLVSAQDD